MRVKKNKLLKILIFYIIKHPDFCELVIDIQLIIICEKDQCFYALKTVLTLCLTLLEFPRHIRSPKTFLFMVKNDTL